MHPGSITTSITVVSTIGMFFLMKLIFAVFVVSSGAQATDMGGGYKREFAANFTRHHLLNEQDPTTLMV